MLLPAQNHGSLIRTSFRKNFKLWIRPTMTTLKSLINKQGGYVVFLVLREYSFIRNFRVYFFKAPFQSFFSWLSNKNLAVQSVQSVQWLGKVPVLVISYSLKSMWLSLTTQYPYTAYALHSVIRCQWLNSPVLGVLLIRPLDRGLIQRINFQRGVRLWYICDIKSLFSKLKS